ncbi:Ribophorin I [Dichotomocladium elegans]|nr:Ribophorin I [Dichotomocladium elegans]
MRFLVRLLLWALILACSGLTQASSDAVAKTSIPIAPNFIISRLIRVVNLRSGVVHEDIGIRAKNIHTEAVNKYIFTVPKNAEARLAYINAFLRQEPKTDLPIKQAGFDSENELQLYEITFHKPLKPNEEIRFGVKIASTHALEPLPAKIPQVARQFVVYADNVYVHSPYPIEELKTTVQLPSQAIQSYTGSDHATVSGSKIVYGPFHSVAPGSYETMRLHFEYSKPILTVTDLRRDLEVSHWGNNLAVEEDYKLLHSGAKLETEFSRVTYQMTRPVHGQTNVLKDLAFTLPAHARDVYYRDEIGNVSTSHLNYEKDSASLVIAPRFPLFGGWKYSWYHGYNVDLGFFDRYIKDTGQYILNVNFVENVNDMVIDRAVVRIILPEGARNVKVDAPFDFDRIDHQPHYSNFDSTGRYMLTLEKHNVVREHEQAIQVAYELPAIRMLQKPLVASGFLFGFFLLSILVSRFSFTIGNPDAKKKKE